MQARAERGSEVSPREYGFDSSFEAYVAGPLAEFVRSRTDRDCLWIAERADGIVGCIAIVGTSEKESPVTLVPSRSVG